MNFNNIRIARKNTYNAKLSLREKIIMTYCKLKQNISYSFLAVLLNLGCSSNCQRIFVDTIQLLSTVLHQFISWPDRDELRKSIPKCFKNFLDVAVVLDCTEVFIQHPSNLTQQIVTYSTYKHDNTLKIMTGVSPAGEIIWISDIYGGRVSDKAIFENSDLISKKLLPGDSVMVDRGFLIDEVCDLNRIKLIRPPFLGDRDKFTKEEAIITKEIAAARIHIERSNQRIKVFKIVGETMPICCTPIFEDIFIVICATVNLGSPILKDDKFLNNSPVIVIA